MTIRGKCIIDKASGLIHSNLYNDFQHCFVSTLVSRLLPLHGITCPAMAVREPPSPDPMLDTIYIWNVFQYQSVQIFKIGVGKQWYQISLTSSSISWFNMVYFDIELYWWWFKYLPSQYRVKYCTWCMLISKYQHFCITYLWYWIRCSVHCALILSCNDTYIEVTSKLGTIFHPVYLLR